MNPDFKTLAERVAALAAPCRETDALVWAAVNGWEPVEEDGGILVALAPDRKVLLGFRSRGEYIAHNGPPLTASVDAVEQVVAEKLPKRSWAIIGAFADGHPAGFIGRDAGSIDLLFATHAVATAPARALLAAALRAMGQTS